MGTAMTEREIQAVVREVTDEEVAFYYEYGWVMMKKLVDPDFSRQILHTAREWVDGDGSTAERPHVHLALEGVEPFDAYGSLYRNTPLADDTCPLLLGTEGEHHEPVAWTCERAGRAFYTSLGHQKDFWELDFLRLVQNGILWSVGQPSTAR